MGGTTETGERAVAPSAMSATVDGLCDRRQSSGAVRSGSRPVRSVGTRSRLDRELPPWADSVGHGGGEHAAGLVADFDSCADREVLVAVELGVVHVGAAGGQLGWSHGCGNEQLRDRGRQGTGTSSG